MKSSLMFGRVRATFIAQNEALEAFLTPGTNPLEALDISSFRNIATVVSRVIRWVVLVAIIGTAWYAEFYIVARSISLTKTGEQGFFPLIFSERGSIEV